MSDPLLTWREWRAHPWRHVVVVLALAMGVALAWSVHLINASALSEFAAAVRTTQGEPDAMLRGARGVGGGIDDEWLDRIAAAREVQHAMAVIEFETHARGQAGASRPMQVLGIDALRIAPLAPNLLPRAAEGESGLSLVDPEVIFLNDPARKALGAKHGEPVWLQSGTQWLKFRVAGDLAVGGAPLAVIDLAAAQGGFGFEGRVSRIDVRLSPGVSPDTLRALTPAGAQWSTPDDASQRVSNLSRAYRVNLMVLALVALLVGGFMAYSVVALSVAQRLPTLALLGVLGMTARERRRLVLGECVALGALGSVVGLVLGAVLAQAALSRLGGDLGGGYFPGVRPALRVEPWAAAAMALLGVGAALVGGWLPARAAERIQPALALKGLVGLDARGAPWWLGVALLALGVALAFMPPIAGVPLAAYASVAALLFGGVALVPVAVDFLLRLAPEPSSAGTLLALRRARFHRHTATAVVAGVVASLALAVALTVMVSSFRQSVTQWLDQVLPADLYMRTAARSALADQTWLDANFERRASSVPGVARAEAARQRALNLAPDRPAVVLTARRLSDQGGPAARLPFVEPPLASAQGEVGVYVSEAMVALYGAKPGTWLELPLATRDGARGLKLRVLGVWRDFARQFGTVVIDLDAYRSLSGDQRLNEMSLWLKPDADVQQVQRALRALVAEDTALEFATTADLRSISLTIFDRSFAVTRYLQAVAIFIGLVGVAAGLSAQVLARRKEFGLLTHLGLRRREILALVAGEVGAWLVAGVVVGLALGLAIGVVLVFVVNPQSFHWTMQMHVPWQRLAILALAVVVSGVATAWWSARHAATRHAAQAVKEDW